MPTKTISPEDAQQYVIRAEDHIYDKKSADASGRTVQKIAVALANADGGEFAVGIIDEGDEPDPEKRWNGRDTVEAFNPILQALFEIVPTLPMDPLFLQSSGHPGYVLLVRIEKSSVVHHTADNTVYVRVGAQSLPLKAPQRIMELQFAKGAASFEDQTLPEVRTEEISDAAELARFLAAYSPKTDPLEFITNQNLVDRASWQPRVAGLLLFNDNPSATLPRKCAVKIARYETKEDDPERDQLKDVFTLEGPLYPLIHRTVEKTTEIMSSVSVWTTTGLRTMQYPPEAVWEVMVNAFIHRDYSISDDIQVYIFDNRIEIVSPGKLPGFITPTNILDSRYSRNPKIVRALAGTLIHRIRTLGKDSTQRSKDDGVEAKET